MPSPSQDRYYCKRNMLGPEAGLGHLHLVRRHGCFWRWSVSTISAHFLGRSLFPTWPWLLGATGLALYLVSLASHRMQKTTRNPPVDSPKTFLCSPALVCKQATPSPLLPPLLLLLLLLQDLPPPSPFSPTFGRFGIGTLGRPKN